MGTPAAVDDSVVDALMAAYDSSLPIVLAYLSRRLGDRTAAEELTAETFCAAAESLVAGHRPVMNTAWVIGIARHKLLDHWRREARDQRRLQLLASEAVEESDPWDAELDASVTRAVLDQLPPTHRAVLVLRYFDDLPMPEVASALDRSLRATESLLVRARAAFRTAYLEIEVTP